MTGTYTPENSRYPDIEVPLVGMDGNAFVLMGAVSNALRDNGVPEEEINEWRREAMSGDYVNLLYTALCWVTVTGGEVSEEEFDYLFPEDDNDYG